MDNIHTPSVPSGPMSGGSSVERKEEVSSLLDLMAEKQLVEEELSALGSVLDSVSSRDTHPKIYTTN